MDNLSSLNNYMKENDPLTFPEVSALYDGMRWGNDDFGGGAMYHKDKSKSANSYVGINGIRLI